MAVKKCNFKIGKGVGYRLCSFFALQMASIVNPLIILNVTDGERSEKFVHAMSRFFCHFALWKWQTRDCGDVLLVGSLLTRMLFETLNRTHKSEF